MKIAIEVAGDCDNGIWSIPRGEGRYCLNLAESFAKNGHQVDCYGPCAQRGISPKINNLRYIRFSDAVKEKYDVFLDACWWKDKKHDYYPDADVYMHAMWSIHDEGMDYRLEDKRHCIVYPYPMSDTKFNSDRNPYKGKSFCLTFPFYNGELKQPKWSNKSIAWTAKVEPHNAIAIQESNKAMEILNHLSKKFELSIHFFKNPNVINGKNDYVPGQEVLGDSVIWHPQTPYGPFRKILESQCKIVLNHVGSLSGACVDGITLGVMTTPIAGGLYDDVASELGILVKNVDDLLPFGEAILGNKDLYDKSVKSFQNIIKPLSSESSVKALEEIVNEMRSR